METFKQNWKLYEFYALFSRGEIQLWDLSTLNVKGMKLILNARFIKIYSQETWIFIGTTEFG
jgi:hypothetical protein